MRSVLIEMFTIIIRIVFNVIELWSCILLPIDAFKWMPNFPMKLGSKIDNRLICFGTYKRVKFSDDLIEFMCTKSMKNIWWCSTEEKKLFQQSSFKDRIPMREMFGVSFCEFIIKYFAKLSECKVQMAYNPFRCTSFGTSSIINYSFCI